MLSWISLDISISRGIACDISVTHSSFSWGWYFILGCGFSERGSILSGVGGSGSRCIGGCTSGSSGSIFLLSLDLFHVHLIDLKNLFKELWIFKLIIDFVEHVRVALLLLIDLISEFQEVLMVFKVTIFISTDEIFILRTMVLNCWTSLIGQMSVVRWVSFLVDFML
jgi:hypothetical protein